MTRLIAVAGRSRSGKGTVARVIAEECAALGLTCLERQLSDNGKWSLARIFHPTIGRAEAVAWFEELKHHDGVCVEIGSHASYSWEDVESVSFQKFLQHGLQEGGRDIFGEHYWTDRIIPKLVLDGDEMSPFSVRWRRDHELHIALDHDEHADMRSRLAWLDGFFDEESGTAPTDVAVISDLRQPNEAQRVCDVGGVVVECVRPESYDAYVTGADHITECGLPDDLVDHRIINDGSVDELEAQARVIFHNHLRYWIRAGAPT
jgi:hypothetical protein